MGGLNMDRRTVLTGLPLATLMAKQAFAQDKGATASPQTKFAAAVMRLPINVPTSADALESVRAKNLQAMVDAIENTMKANATNKPRIIVFPVLQLTSARRSVSGVPMSAVAVDLVSKPLDQGVFKPVIEACRRHNCYVATSTQEKVPQLPGKFFHTGVIMGPDGLVLRSPKSQAQSAPEVSYLRDMADEYTKVFGPDSILPVAKTPVGTLACYVEGEAEVLEVSRLVASKGAEIILHTSMESDETPWIALKQAIGFQCHVYLLTGTTSRHLYANKPEEWAGGSATIIAPDGEVLGHKSGKDEGAVIAEIDLAAVAEAKKKFGRNTVPAWNLYSKLYKG
jgi:predicted amidohydrolase